MAQSSAPPSAPAQSDNPFPGETSAATPRAGQNGGAKPDSAKPKAESDNPFPGEDPNAPIIPVNPEPGNGAGRGRSGDSGAGSRPSGSGSGTDAAQNARRDSDPEGDPVRSPDPLGNSVPDDGFSSSRAGLTQLPGEEENDSKPGKPKKSLAQTVKEDIDIGEFYLDKRNWKAAQARFTTAFVLDSENPEAVWGLAEAERHLQLSVEAAAHYKVYLSYDPDGPHSRAARKALEEVEAARPAGAPSKAAATNGVPLK